MKLNMFCIELHKNNTLKHLKFGLLRTYSLFETSFPDLCQVYTL